MKRAAKAGITYDALKRDALALPEVSESTSYGTAALKVRGKLMVRLKEDGETVVLRIPWEERERLLTLHPEVFYLTDHYRPYDCVLLRLAKAPADLVPQWLELSWALVAPKTLVAKRLGAGRDGSGGAPHSAPGTKAR